MKKTLYSTLLLCSLSSTGWALNYNQDITAIFGSGNPDGGWTTGTGGGLTLGLRAKNRDNGQTPNVDGVYSFATGYSSSNPARALWNYEFSINVGAQAFSMYDFYLGIDQDSSAGVNYSLSLINPLSIADNKYGNSGTPNGGGVLLADYEPGSPTIAQNSLNIVFGGLDPNAPGTYDYRLFAVSKLNPDVISNSPLPQSGGNPFIDSLPTATQSSPVADVNIQVIVGAASVPDAGSTLALIGLGLAGLAGISRRKIA